MTTVGLHAERMVELKLRAELCECLAKQNAELEELMEMHAKAEGVIERQNEDIAERVDEICKSHALGTAGPTSAQLRSISQNMQQLQAWRERFERLVMLCVNAERTCADPEPGLLTTKAVWAIGAEVDRIKAEAEAAAAEDVPF